MLEIMRSWENVLTEWSLTMHFESFSQWLQVPGREHSEDMQVIIRDWLVANIKLNVLFLLRRLTLWLENWNWFKSKVGFTKTMWQESTTLDNIFAHLIILGIKVCLLPTCHLIKCSHWLFIYMCVCMVYVLIELTDR